MSKPKRTRPEPPNAADIRKVRGEMHWTQEDLAEKLGVNQATVSRWETGELIIQGAERLLFDRLREDLDRVL